ncbi:hypothetical protein EJ05DRAFT_477899 [Pseudovirgaria hyperparasitica]|uniref:RRM domain-containing protein n=1 Tax=Pseudovirgaria hyperparasitica TaxID=470096 RepID=A0A6A6W1M6_9PEZI|nr:uncharacterized protein EJ05DRAFT_477899 [Pseudovirgaria hyperparasitica]KAF2755830.1 hypothetical protein EJ05DRAFT_477899 [Pseudovirgaria hyperparasitica]
MIIAPPHFVRVDDVRTTLMLRNLPNGMTSFELKYLIDGMARNMYNFLYLRMDFQTGNNVGYGFVNFDDPDAAVQFAGKWQGLTWIINHTTKVAAVSYATTQGKENQIARFRNSGLRLQPAPNRPKLFVSLFDFAEESMSGRALGEEIPLPHVDNHTKLNRSVMNGRNNGLYSRARRTGQANLMQGLFDNGNPHNPPEFDSIFSFAHQFSAVYNK